jgi:mannose-1-phosphate guanylyltransferase
VLEPSALARMPGDQKLSIERVVFPQMVADKSLFAMSTDDYWIDAGRPDTFISANVHVSKRVVKETDAPIHPTANVAVTAVILQRSWRKRNSSGWGTHHAFGVAARSHCRAGCGHH